MEKQLAHVSQTNTKMWQRVEKQDEDLLAAIRDSEVWKEKARASEIALTKVKAAFDFPADTLNQALVYNKSLKGTDVKNLGKIIAFLMDQSKELEGIWNKMRKMITDLPSKKSKAYGTELPEQPLPGAAAADPSGTNPRQKTEAPASAFLDLTTINEKATERV